MTWARLCWCRTLRVVALARQRAGPDGALLLATIVPLAVVLIVAGVLFLAGAGLGWTIGTSLGLAVPVAGLCIAGARHSPEALHERVVSLTAERRAQSERMAAERRAWAARQAAQQTWARAQPTVQQRPDAGPIRHYFTTLAGMAHANADGSDRHKIARHCQRYERLALVHEPDNPHDENAVAVKRADGAMLGYIPAHVAENMAWQRDDRGWRHVAVLAGWNAPTQDFPEPAPLLAVLVIDPDVSADAVDDYIDRHVVQRTPT